MVAEEVAAEPAARAQRVHDPAPQVAEILGRDEREAEARVHEVDGGPGRLLETRDLGRHLRVVEIPSPSEAHHRFRLSIDRDHAPASADELGGVPPGSRAEIHGQARLLEAIEGVEESCPRLVAGRVVEPTPVSHEGDA